MTILLNPKEWRAILLMALFLCTTVSFSAQDIRDSLSAVLASEPVDSNKVNLLIDWSKEYLGYEESLEELDEELALQAYELSTEIGYPSGQAWAFRYLGLAEYYNGNYGGAVDYWQQGLAVFEKLGDKSNVAGLTSNIGAVYFNYSDNVKALEFYLRSLKVAEEISDTMRMMQVLTNIGAVYGQNENTYTKALEYDRRALRLGELVHDDQIVGTLCANIAEILLAQKGKFLETAEDSAQYISLLDPSVQFSSDFIDSSAYYAHRNDSLALYYFNLANVAFQGTIDETYALIGMGKVYNNRLEYDKALIFQKKGLNIARELDTQLDICQAMLHIASTYEGKKDYKQALKYYHDAELIADELGLKADQRLTYEGLAELYSKKGDFKDAFKYQSLLIDIKDTLYSIDYAQKMDGQMFNFDLEKKQDEIALLNKDNELQALETDRQKFAKNASLIGLSMILAIAFILLKMYRTKVKTNKILDEQKDQIETLLLNTLPAEVVRELELYGESKPKNYELVSILFTDFKGFTTIASTMSPQELIEELTMFFGAFDDIMGKHDIEKIKTIGDAYMCAGGVPNPDPDHPRKIILAGLEIQSYMGEVNEKRRANGQAVWELRVGIHSGPVVAGVVGKKKYAYDIWGSSVNTASRMESNGEPGKVNISSSTFDLVKEDFACTYRGKISAKNIGEIDMYFVDVESEDKLLSNESLETIK